MATQLEGSIKRWIGLSSDTKPGAGAQPDGSRTPYADIPVGSSFLESDTGIVWRWTGASWVSAQPDNRVVELLTQILDECKRERIIQEVALDVRSDDYVDPMVT